MAFISVYVGKKYWFSWCIKFYRFKEGLGLLGVVKSLQEVPTDWYDLFCGKPRFPTYTDMSDFFVVDLDEKGTNNYTKQLKVLGYFQDYLVDVRGM